MHQVKRTVTPVLVDTIYLFSVSPEFSLFFFPQREGENPDFYVKSLDF